MKITLTGKQVDIGDRLRSHIEENVLNSVTKYFSDPIGCNVAFSKEGDEFSAEVTVHPAKNIVLKGTGTAGDPYTAFDNANSHIAVRLSKHKNRLKDSEAVMYMDLANECALMFRNAANNHISMVYRRKDGNIGWVEPKADN